MIHSHDLPQKEVSSQEWDNLLENTPLKFVWKDTETPFDESNEEDYFYTNRTPTAEEIEDQNHYLLKRQKVFRMAAEYFTREASQLSWVMTIALIGSVAQPLKKEVPRFRDYRRSGIEVWHECKDVDVAIWVSQLSDLNALRKARSEAVKKMSSETEGLANVAHHQLDVFILDQKRNLYMGNLCTFKSCPNDKPECFVQGCGAAPFLRKYEDFHFYSEAIHPDRIRILFDRHQEMPKNEDASSFSIHSEDDMPF
jgi:hypothetical protein